MLTVSKSDGHVTVSGAVNPVAQTKDEIDRHLTESTGSGSGGSTPRSYVIGGSTVEVVRGDLTTLSVDAIVSTANRRLDYVGRHAKAILVAGIANFLSFQLSKSLPIAYNCLLRTTVN